jgi:GH15 family glucan-1,4-alpha-glucosidase
VSALPALDGVISADEVHDTATHLASLQLDTGMIPWFEGGHCDPWNHVETAMALDVAGLHTEARDAYRWLADIQRPDGSWWNYYLPDGSVE